MADNEINLWWHLYYGTTGLEYLHMFLTLSNSCLGIVSWRIYHNPYYMDLYSAALPIEANTVCIVHLSVTFEDDQFW
jgi:hypothetical protein